MASNTDRACVVAGHLNPYILTPPWVAKNVYGETLVESPDLPPDSVVLGSLAGLIPAYTVPGHGVVWTAALNRLQAFATEPEADAGEFVARILDVLKHMPLGAVGNNFDFSLEDQLVEGVGRLYRPAILDAAAGKGWSVLGTAGTLKVTSREAVLNVSFDDTERPAVIRFNFHRDVATAEEGATAARHWLADRSEAERMIAWLREAAR